ncbi:ArgE/DapE family deacylase [uncultured Roseibium sp.]|uniref:ArgE/DapE family deacylase n=1 Tax=uncultured Roseibium sp. TaxID=1936171 RepID=UPI00321763CF
MTEPLSPSEIDRIKQAVEANFETQVSFLQDLVRSASLRGEEAEVQTMVARALVDRRYDVERFSVDPQAVDEHPAYSPATIDYADTFNVSGMKMPKAQRGKSLILNAHTDVVPTADPSAWTYPPFSATRDGDWLYGRGAGDMKSGLVANIFAVDAIEAAGFRLTAPLQIQSVVDEETTGNGAAAAIHRGYTADAVLIPEPTDEQLVFANSGVIKFKITTRGVPAHPRDPDSGLSAIDAAIQLIAHLKGLEKKWNEERHKHPGFEKLRNPASLNVGTISGGEWPSSVPFACVFEGRIGFFPGEDPWERAKEVEDSIAALMAKDTRLARSAPTVEWVGTMQAGYRLADTSPAEDALRKAHGLVHNDALGRYIMACYLDATLFANHAGIPALTYGPAAENIHGIDERVNLSSLKRVTETIALFTAGWCGIEPA